MVNKLSALIVVLGVFFLSGCATRIHPYKIQDLGTEHVLNKNYTVGVQEEIFVGDAIVSVKDYYVTKYSSQVVTPSSDFSFDGGISHVKGEKDSSLAVVGNKIINGIEYRVVELKDPDAPFAHILIDSNGKAHSNLLVKSASPYGGFVTVIYDHAMTPNYVKFISESKQEVSKDNGFINYELIYNGRDDKSFYITYREFSPDNLARPSFFQTLTYSLESKRIRFQKNLIKVHSVDNEKIIFTVMEDPYT